MGSFFSQYVVSTQTLAADAAKTALIRHNRAAGHPSNAKLLSKGHFAQVLGHGQFRQNKTLDQQIAATATAPPQVSARRVLLEELKKSAGITDDSTSTPNRRRGLGLAPPPYVKLSSVQDKAANGLEAYQNMINQSRDINRRYLEVQYKNDFANLTYMAISNLMKTRSEAIRGGIRDTK